MKKLVILLVVVVLAFAGFITWKAYQPMGDMAVTGEGIPAYDGAMTAEAAAAEVSHLDYEAIRALYADDQVVMTVYGQDVTWEEYYSWLYMNAMQVEAYFEQMAMYYGMSADWSGSVGDGSGMVYAQLPAASAEDTLLRFAAIEKMAAEKGVSLSEESLAALEDKALAEAVIGEGAELSELLAALEETGMSLESYKHITAVNYLYGDVLSAEYGSEGELVSDEDVGIWLSEQGYLAANHILFMTMDKGTGEAVDEATAAEKKAKADEIYAELCTIEDVEELVKRFRELKEEYDEDTGKTYYPDGYTFVPGTMVAEFEDTVTSMSDYQFSEPVKTSYGWHIIIRMPLNGSNLLSDSSGNLVPAAWMFAQQEMGSELEAYLVTDAIEYAEGFEQPDLLKFVK